MTLCCVTTCGSPEGIWIWSVPSLRSAACALWRRDHFCVTGDGWMDGRIPPDAATMGRTKNPVVDGLGLFGVGRLCPAVLYICGPYRDPLYFGD